LKDIKFTVFLIPSNSPRRYEFTITRRTIITALVAFCILISLFFVIVIHYAFIRDMALENLELKKENQILSQSLKDISAETRRLSDALNKIEVFKNKIKLLANINDTERGLSIGPVEMGRNDNIVNIKSLEDLSYLNNSTKMMRLSILSSRIHLLSSEFESAQKELEEVNRFFEERKDILRSTPARWPCYGWVTSEFGFRYDPFTGEKTFHKGLDIATAMNTPVVAPADGVVVSTYFHSGLGNELVIDHGLGITTVYGHLNEFKVKVGDRVERGQIIATVGNSGRSTGPHLHYEVIVNGINVNPRKYIIE